MPLTTRPQLEGRDALEHQPCDSYPLAASLSLLAAAACADTVTRTPPPLPPTPTLEERRVQTPIDTGNNTRVVDGDIHVWYIPCPPGPPPKWVAPITLTHLSSGSHLYLNKDGSLSKNVFPDYRTDEGRERLEQVLKDDELMERILTRPDCP